MQLQPLKYDDVLFVYKEQWFTGFAPCFDNNIFSLACCKGNRKNAGMKGAACKHYEKSQNVWILSVAGKNITLKGHNKSIENYEHNDLIYLSKVKNCYTWNEYYKKYKERRSDAIYNSENGSIICVDKRAHSEKDIPTDCATDNKDSFNLKQIIISDEYYVFKSGIKVPEQLNVFRGYKYKNNNPLLINEFLKQNNISYTCQSPFIKKYSNRSKLK